MLLPRLFSQQNALAIAKTELEQNKCSLLAMQSTAEHATKMVEYYSNTVKRLSKYIQEESIKKSLENMEEKLNEPITLN